MEKQEIKKQKILKRSINVPEQLWDEIQEIASMSVQYYNRQDFLIQALRNELKRAKGENEYHQTSN